MKPIRHQRQKVVPLAQGRVLEVGLGTGLNLPYYDKSKITQIVGLDPAFHRLTRKRIQSTRLPVELAPLSAEKIPFPASSFDSIVMTYTLCTIPDPVAALREMRRVLKPNGKLFFCEHGRAPDEKVYRWQSRLQPYWRKISGDCHLNRDIPALLREAGLECKDLQEGYLPGPRFLTYNYWGEAVIG